MEMTLNEMIELVRQHHPHMQDNEIRLLLNRASDDFCAKTEIIKDSFSQNILLYHRYDTVVRSPAIVSI